VDIERVDPMEVDLDLADQLVAVDRVALERAALEVPPQSGPSRMTSLQNGNNGRAFDGLWVATDGTEVVGWASLELPRLENLDAARVRAIVHPGHRRQGIGSRLLDAALDVARDHRRTFVTTMAWEDTDGVPFLEAQGFTTSGQHPYDVRRLDLHETPATRWRHLYDEAAESAGDYELVHVVGPTPDNLIDGMVALHEAINDAPADEGMEPDVWDAAGVRDYDASMARRRQTTYRALARHRQTGQWAGMSLLCVDEFAPRVAFQEDTNVIRAHRGHRLGLLMKADMLLWVAAERPEIAATHTWNAVDNHHMIAVNERLGCRVIARNIGFRRSLVDS
jgi:GNAT superfamily N-acetyltransferase